MIDSNYKFIFYCSRAVFTREYLLIKSRRE